MMTEMLTSRSSRLTLSMNAWSSMDPPTGSAAWLLAKRPRMPEPVASMAPAGVIAPMTPPTAAAVLAAGGGGRAGSEAAAARGPRRSFRHGSGDLAGVDAAGLKLRHALHVGAPDYEVVEDGAVEGKHDDADAGDRKS